jgi:hypothetical protein
LAKKFEINIISQKVNGIERAVLLGIVEFFTDLGHVRVIVVNAV